MGHRIVLRRVSLLQWLFSNYFPDNCLHTYLNSLYLCPTTSWSPPIVSGISRVLDTTAKPSPDGLPSVPETISLYRWLLDTGVCSSGPLCLGLERERTEVERTPTEGIRFNLTLGLSTTPHTHHPMTRGVSDSDLSLKRPHLPLMGRI